jgi:malonate transporter
MLSMLAILAITGPIYITIALGYLLTRRGLFARADMRVLGQFVIRLALPALLFNALAQRKVGDILNGRYLLVYALGSLVTLGLGLLWARRGARQDATTSVYYAMGMSCSNNGFVGYPVALLVLGPVASVMLGLNMIVENLLLIPLLLALAEISGEAGGRWPVVLRQALAALVRNPMVLGLLAGFAVSLLEWKMPSPMERTLTLFAQSSAALSLFVIGGSLAGLQLAGLRGPVVQIALGKLLLHPAAVVAVLLLCEAAGMVPMEPALRTGVVLAAASPMFGIYPILAQKTGHDGLAAGALLGATVASFFTISALLWTFRQLPGWGG